MTDAELVTLAVMQALLGFTSEARWVRHASVYLRHASGPRRVETGGPAPAIRSRTDRGFAVAIDEDLRTPELRSRETRLTTIYPRLTTTNDGT